MVSRFVGCADRTSAASDAVSRLVRVNPAGTQGCCGHPAGGALDSPEVPAVCREAAYTLAMPTVFSSVSLSSNNDATTSNTLWHADNSLGPAPGVQCLLSRTNRSR